MTLLACGGCSDAIFKSAYWWAVVSHPLFLALLLQAFVFMVMPKTPFRAKALGASIVLLIAGVFIGAGVEISLWIAMVPLFASLLISLRRDVMVPRWLQVARVSLVVVAMLVGVIRAWPSQRSTDELIAVLTAYQRGPGWIHAELLKREDSRETIERELRMTGSDKLIALHRQLGYPAEGRREACQQLLAEARERLCPGEF